MLSDRKLLFRAALITVFIALVGVGVLYAIYKITGTEEPELLNSRVYDKNQAVQGDENIQRVNDPFIDREAIDREFIQTVFPVVSQWNLESVQPYFARDTLRQSARNEDFSNVMSTLSDNLGKLHSFEEPSRIEGWNEGRQGEGDGLTEYRFLAYYELGQAEVNMVLSHTQGQNSLYAMSIEVIN